MAYMHGNLAEQVPFETQVTGQPRRAERTSARPRFDVIPGTRQSSDDALAPWVCTAIRAARVAAVYVLVLFLVALTLTGVTRLVMESDAAIESSLADSQAQSKQLEVQVAINEDSNRILQYSTEVYGMVPASQVSTVEVSSATQGEQSNAE
jgi:hypothetical protein